jgi:Brp/Blh family beta-carotene 15,15'-monooxygenase
MIRRIWFKEYGFELSLALALLVALVAPNFSGGDSLLLGLIVLLSLLIGMPHGAYDVIAITRISRSLSDLALLNIVYLVLAAGALLFWVELAKLFWPIFYVFSLLHFLMIEWEMKKKSKVFAPDLAFASLFVLPLFHPEEFFRVFTSLHGWEFAHWLLSWKPLWIGIFVGLLIWRLIFFSNRLKHLVLLGLLFLIFYFADLYWAFFSFFVLLHSWRHLQLNRKSHGIGFSRAFLFVLLPVSAAIMLFMVAGLAWGLSYVPVLLLGLICLSFPHALLDIFLKYRMPTKLE